jgi:hypothetical protein
MKFDQTIQTHYTERLYCDDISHTIFRIDIVKPGHDYHALLSYTEYFNIELCSHRGYLGDSSTLMVNKEVWISDHYLENHPCPLRANSVPELLEIVAMRLRLHGYYPESEMDWEGEVVRPFQQYVPPTEANEPPAQRARMALT